MERSLSIFLVLIICSLNNSLTSQNEPDFFEVEYSFNFFRDNGFKKIIETVYYNGVFNPKDQFSRGDKNVYTFEDSLIKITRLKRNNKPYKKRTEYLKQDSIGKSFNYDKKYGSNYNKYIIRDSLIMRDNTFDYTYDSQRRIIKQKTTDTSWIGSVRCCGMVWEYKYIGDSIREDYNYRYNGSPDGKFDEAITKIYFKNKRAYKFVQEAYDYTKQKYVWVASGTYLTIKTDTGFKFIYTCYGKEQNIVFIKEFLY